MGTNLCSQALKPGGKPETREEPEEWRLLQKQINGHGCGMTCFTIAYVCKDVIICLDFSCAVQNEQEKLQHTCLHARTLNAMNSTWDGFDSFKPKIRSKQLANSANVGLINQFAYSLRPGNLARLSVTHSQ